MPALVKSTQQQHLPQHLDTCLPFFCCYAQHPSTFSSMSLCYLDELKQECITSNPNIKSEITKLNHYIHPHPPSQRHKHWVNKSTASWVDHGKAQWGCVTFDKLIMLHHVVCNCNRLASNDLHYLGVKANMILPSVGAPCPAVCLYQVIRLLGPQGGPHIIVHYTQPHLLVLAACKM